MASSSMSTIPGARPTLKQKMVSKTVKSTHFALFHDQHTMGSKEKLNGQGPSLGVHQYKLQSNRSNGNPKTSGKSPKAVVSTVGVKHISGKDSPVVVVSIDSKAMLQRGPSQAVSKSALQGVPDRSLLDAEQAKMRFGRRMLEDTGGSTDNPATRAKEQSNLIQQAAKRHQKQALQSQAFLSAYQSGHNHQSALSRKTPSSGKVGMQGGRDRTHSDNSIKGRKLSPNTEFGMGTSATGSDSGVRLLVNFTDQGKQQNPAQSYSSEYLPQQSNVLYKPYQALSRKSLITGVPSSSQTQRGLKQTRSTSLLRHRQQQVQPNGHKATNAVQTARFGAQDAGKKGGKQNTDISFGAKSKKGQPKLAKHVSEKNLGLQARLGADKKTSEKQFKPQFLQSSASAILPRPLTSKSSLPARNPSKPEIVRKPVSIKPSTSLAQKDNIQKKRQSVASTSQCKPNAVTYSRLMANQQTLSKQTPAFAEASRSSLIKKSSFIRSKSPTDVRSVGNDRVLAQSTQAKNLNQRNESGCTGEISILPKRQRSSSSEISPALQINATKRPVAMKNSQSSFQLTFSNNGQPAPRLHQQRSISPRQQAAKLATSPSADVFSNPRIQNVSERQRKSYAGSHSPGNRQLNHQASAIQVVKNPQHTDALRLFKVLQRKMQQEGTPADLNLRKPYSNMLQHHSKSVAHAPIENSRIQQTYSIASQSAGNESEKAVSEGARKSTESRLGLMKKMLSNYQQQVIKPAQDKLSRKKRSILAPNGYQRDSNSASPRQTASTSLLPKQRSIGQSKKERKEQKRRVKELRQKRKAIEAKTREMKLKSVKSHRALLQCDVQGKAQGGAVSAKSVKNVPKSDIYYLGSRPQYTVVRSNMMPAESRASDLVNSIGFQKHQNLPLQMKNGETPMPRKSSNSSERVEWDPIARPQPKVPLRCKGTHQERSKGLGLEYQQLKRELAMELPMALAPTKKIKTATPSTNVQAIAKDKRLGNSTSVNKKKVPLIKNERRQQPITLEPRIIESDRAHQSAKEALLKVEANKQKQTLEPTLLDSDRPVLSKDKQRRLVEQQKRQWQQKEKQHVNAQLSEQQRILKNLERVHRVARVQASKATKHTVRKVEKADKGGNKSARGSAVKFGENEVAQRLVYRVSEHLDDTSLVSCSQVQSRSEQKRKQQAKARHHRPDSLINVQIRSVPDSEVDELEYSNQVFDKVSQPAQELPTYISPARLPSASGTTGAAESDRLTSSHSVRIMSNAAGKPQSGIRDPLRQQTRLNPATLYQLHAQTKLSVNEDQMGQGSLSHRHSMSHSSNLNYSPTTSQEKRSGSLSTNKNPRSISRSRSRRTRTKLKSASSRKSSHSQQTRKSRKKGTDQKHELSLEGKRRVISKFNVNKRLAQKPCPPVALQEVSQVSEDLDKEDLIIFIILTQAARMIQRAYRNFNERRRAQLQDQANSYEQIVIQKSPIQNIVRHNNVTIQAQSQPSQQRKHTFSFGNQNQIVNVQQLEATPSRREQADPDDDHIQVTNQSRLVENLRSLLPSSQRSPQPTTPQSIVSQPSGTIQLQSAEKPPQAHKAVSLKGSKQQTADFTSAQPRRESHCEYEILQLEAGSDSKLDECAEDSLRFERVSSSQRESALARGIDVSGEDYCFERVRQQLQLSPESSDSQDASNLEVIVRTSEIEQASDEGNIIVAEAGEEDISLQGILLEEQRRPADESLMGSVAERTDLIINCSGALNTSDEGNFVENTVSVHGVMDVNPYSAQSSANKHPTGHSKMGSKTASMESSFDYAQVVNSNPAQVAPTTAVQGLGSGAWDQNKKKILRMVSGDERFLIKEREKSEHEQQAFASGTSVNPNTETHKEALQFISQLNSAAQTNVGNQSVDEYQIRANSADNSFQNALYPAGMQSRDYNQNLSQVSYEQEESKDSLQLLVQKPLWTSTNPYNSTGPSFFLQTNASIFERNPFQDFTASKVNALMNGGKGGAYASTDFNNVERLVQMKEDALKFITMLEQGWIARQEKMSMLSPKQSNLKRFELEQWVTSQRKAATLQQADQADFKPSVTQVRAFCKQVGSIVQTVNKKADEIREQLYQRSQDASVKKQMQNGYSEMHKYKRALGLKSSSDELTEEVQGQVQQLQNIDVVDQSQQEIELQDEVKAKEIQTEHLEISEEEFKSNEAPSPPEIVTKTRLNYDIIPTPPSESATESLTSEANERLTEEVTDRILAHLLQDELYSDNLQKVFKREVSAAQEHPAPRVSPSLEVAVVSEANFNINQSISVDQIIAGVDTSLEAVDQYVEGIFAQIRVRARQFMNAFYTPIYRNPMAVLQKIQRQGLLQGGEKADDQEPDLANTLSSILNVQLYLTLEKARENVIREALQQIKEAAAEGEDLALDSNLSELLSESDHIHNKAIFDSVNEALNLVRPYGRFGEPMPWSSRPRKNFFVFATEADLEGVLDIVKSQVMGWAEIKAGQISSSVVPKQQIDQQSQGDDKEGDEEGKENSEAGVIRQAAFKQMSEETLAMQREKSLAKLLTSDIKAQEEKWVDYEAEETQVKVDISDHILEMLVKEMAQELTQLGKQ